MSRLSPKADVLRALFARSGNRCAFPGCTSPLINERNQFIAQVCHIEAAEEGGERFNQNQTDEERRHYENLLILCYPHHIETNDVAACPVRRLREIKAAHEHHFEKNPFKIDESVLYKVALEMEQYWSRVETLHKDHHVVSDLAIEIDVKANFSQLIEYAHSLAADVLQLRDILLQSDDALAQDLVALLDELGVPESALESHRERTRPFHARNWEALNLGLTNIVTKLHVALSQMEIKYLEEFAKLNPNDFSARLRLEALKVEFEALAISAGYVD
jgi:hypothetical protein